MKFFFLTPYKGYNKKTATLKDECTTSNATAQENNQKTNPDEVSNKKNNQNNNSAEVNFGTFCEEDLQENARFWAHFASFVNNLLMYMHILITGAVFVIPFLIS